MHKLSHKKRKKIARYQFAIAAFETARRAADLLLSGEYPRKHPANEHFFTSLIVCYFRPFTSNNGIGPLEESDLPAETMKDHNLLKRLRHEAFGHTDTLTEFDNGAKTNRLRVEVESGAVYFSATRIYFGEDILNRICGHLDRLVEVCQNGMDPIYDKIDLSTLVPGDYILNLAKDSDELLIPRNSGS